MSERESMFEDEPTLIEAMTEERKAPVPERVVIVEVVQAPTIKQRAALSSLRAAELDRHERQHTAPAKAQAEVAAVIDRQARYLAGCERRGFACALPSGGDALVLGPGINAVPGALWSAYRQHQPVVAALESGTLRVVESLAQCSPDAITHSTDVAALLWAVEQSSATGPESNFATYNAARLRVLSVANGGAKIRKHESTHASLERVVAELISSQG